MWKKSRLILFILFVSGCSYFKTEKSSTILKSHVEKYLDVFLEEVKGINPEKNRIVLESKVLNDKEYILLIMSDINSGGHSHTYYKDTIYSCEYKGFTVLSLDKNKKLTKNVTDKNIIIPSFDEEHIPVSYDGAFWELKIHKQELIDFSYKFCEPDTEVFDRLKSIPISDNTETKEDD